MSIVNILELIERDSNCELIRVNRKELDKEILLPEDLKYFYQNYDGIDFYKNESFGIKIVSYQEFKVTNTVLFPEDDIIWEELEGDISNNWYLIASSEELGQYISIDLSQGEKKGYCYDSFIETHSHPEDSMIIAKSFTELLERIYESKGKEWYWTLQSFSNYGDAYD